MVAEGPETMGEPAGVEAQIAFSGRSWLSPQVPRMCARVTVTVQYSLQSLLPRAQEGN